MLVLAIAGGIILALVLLPFLGPIAIIAGVAVIAIFAIGIGSATIQGIKDTVEEQKQENERLAKLPEEERNAEIQRINKKRRKRMRVRILIPIITFAFVFLIGAFATNFDLEFMLDPMELGLPAGLAITALIVVILVQRNTD